MNAFVSAVEGAIYYASKIFKSDLTNYCDIAIGCSPTILETNEGDMVTGVAIDGFSTAVGPEEFESLMKGVHLALQTKLKQQGRAIEFYASRDPEGAYSALTKQSTLQKASAARIGLDVDDMIDSNVGAVAKHVAHEVVLLGLWSSPQVLSSAEQKSRRSDVPVGANPLIDQLLADQSDVLKDSHEGFVKSVVDDLNAAGVICRILTTHETLRAARMAIDPEFTSPDWAPLLNGDAHPLRKRGAIQDKTPGNDLDVSDLLFQPVANQMFPRSAERVNSRHLRVGDRVYAPIYMDVPPKEVMPFDDLFSKLSQEDIPWRMKIRIDGGGSSFLTLKKVLSQIMVIGSISRKIRESFDAMEDVEFAGAVSVHLKVAFATWAPAEDRALLVKRASKLAGAIQSWGGPDVAEAPGDQTLGFMSSVPFVCKTMGSAGAIGPLGHVIRMLPITRPFTPWKTGSVLLQTLDGKPFPFEPGSDLQTTWVYLVCGRPGYGKSVQVNSMLLAGAIKPGLARLPFISILDIGASGGYFVNSLRDSLPESQKHLVGAWSIRNTEENTVNVCDLPLGCVQPLSEHRNFLVNFITKAVTAAGSAAGEASALVSQMVTATYEKLNTTGMRAYEPGVEPIVDDELKRIGLGQLERFRHALKWRHVVDHLFVNQSIHAASLAQRHAVPTLEDFGAIPEEILKDYRNAQTPLGGSLIDAYRRGLKAALTEYKIIAGRTKFDIGQVRIAALDLEPVCGTKGSPEGDKRTALMYMLGQFILTKDYRLSAERVREMSCPDAYRPYHMARVDDVKNDLKWMVMDEFHRGASCPEVVNVTEQDCREGRKYNICVLLASQEIEDFPEIICSLATGTFIMDMKEGQDGEALVKRFSLRPSVASMATQYVKGRTAKGVPLLAVMSLKGQKNMVRVLISTLGPSCLWGLSTGAEDAQVRSKVSAAVGGKAARLALTKHLPSMAESRVKALKGAGRTDAISDVANEVLSKIGA